MVSNMHRSYLSRGIDAKLGVGTKTGNDPGVFAIPNDNFRSLYTRFLLRTAGKLERSTTPGAWRVSRILDAAAIPKRWFDRFLGIEDFNYPAARNLLEIAGSPDVIHFHNLHGNYFDLRALASLSQQVPAVVTLHDAWLLSGHCAHSLDCDRWQTGCGNCPDLNIYPAVNMDRTHLNWVRKREIFKNCRLSVVTPCNWLMEKARKSILAPAIVNSRIIPNGIDLSTFSPGSQSEDRRLLDIPNDRFVALVCSPNINLWYDFAALRAGLRAVQTTTNPLCIVLGGSPSREKWGAWEVHTLPYQSDKEKIAQYYRSADVYLQISKADTFPTTVLEALACGIPVIASDAGGIPEQIRALADLEMYDNHEVIRDRKITGFLTYSGDAATLAGSLERLMKDQSLRQIMGVNAREIACERFSLEQEVDQYLSFYEEILGCAAS